MSYKTRPYIKNTFLLASSPFTSYEVKDRKLFVHRAFQSPQQLDLSGNVSTIPENSFSLGPISIGDVRVKTQSAEVLCKNIRNIAAFIAAIDGNATQEATTPLWHAGLTAEDLADTAIIIPAAPTQVLSLIDRSGIKLKPNSEHTPPKTGDWIQKGDFLARMNGIDCYAPFSGRITFYKGYKGTLERGWDIDTQWAMHTTIGFQDRLKNMSLAIIQPLRNEQVNQSYIQETYQNAITYGQQALSTIEQLSAKRFSRLFDGYTPFEAGKEYYGSSQFPPAINKDDWISDTFQNGRSNIIKWHKQHLDMLKNATGRDIASIPPLSIPEWPSREWIAENAPNAGLEYIRNPDLPTKEPSLNM